MISLSLIPVLTLIQFASALFISQQAQAEGSLRILDKGVGHRSTPVPQWRTSLRTITRNGTQSAILQQFGPESQPGSPAEPIGATALGYSASTSSLFLATGSGIIRTALDGSNPEVILAEDAGQIMSLMVAEKQKKVYYGTAYDGLVKRADLDGKNIEVVRNVSQGLKWEMLPSYSPAYSYADGLWVDEDNDYLYWSASRGPDNGSIRRATLTSTGSPDASRSKEQILASGIDMPGQLRLVKDTGTLWWTEKGRWSNSPTAIKYLVVSKIPNPSSSSSSSTSSSPPAVETNTVIHSNQSSLFVEKDYTGDPQTLSIMSFVVYRDQVEQRVYFVVQSSGRTMFGKLVEVTWRGSGGGRGPVMEVKAGNVTDVGVPIGLEYVR